MAWKAEPWSVNFFSKILISSVLSTSPNDTYEEYLKQAKDPQTYNEHFAAIERDVADV